jgi:coenzyme F420-dependent glucose-6-phosphate dehydrogenase
VTLRIGYKASAEQFDPGRLAAYAVLAEELGFDSRDRLSDHYQPWRLDRRPRAERPRVDGVRRSPRPSGCSLGTSVMTPTFRYNPAVVAQEFATLACLAPGRVFLGVGSGEALNEIAVGSVEEWPEFKERFARLREAVTLMRRLWTDDEVSFEGDYYTTHGARIFDRPEQPVPVYVAAGGPAGRAVCRPRRRRLHLHLGQGPRAVCR